MDEDIVVIWGKERKEVTMKGPCGPKNMMLKNLGIIKIKYAQEPSDYMKMQFFCTFALDLDN